MNPTTPLPAAPVVLTAKDIAALPLVPLDQTIPGVAHRIVWRSDTSIAGVMVIAAGHQLGNHAHRANHHHMWMIDGSAVIMGTMVGPGGYVHIPAGVEHDVDARATSGCTVFYLYQQPPA
jgi:mannose-6-phosphate isomerase-like protein (cupin superfamily)